MDDLYIIKFEENNAALIFCMHTINKSADVKNY